MIKFLKELVTGEPVWFFQIVSLGSGAAVPVIVAQGGTVPLWLAILVPVSTALGAYYARGRVSPV